MLLKSNDKHLTFFTKGIIFAHHIQCIAESFGQNEAVEAVFEAALNTRKKCL
jgi:hypothetical protein